MTEESKIQIAASKEKAAAASPTAPVKSSASASGMPLAMSSIAIAVSLLAGGASFYVWDSLTKASQNSQTNVQSAIRHSESRTDDFQTDLKQMKESLQQFDSRLGKTGDDALGVNKKMLELQSAQDGFVESINKMREELGRSAVGWQLAEVTYLLDIANQQIFLQKNVATAVAALEEADRKLLELGDPAFLKVREAILSEAGSLKAVRTLDRAGIAMKVRALAEQLKSLKMKGAQYEPAKASVDGVVAKQEKILSSDMGWKEKFIAAWNEFLVAIQDTVHIRNQRVIPMLSAEQEYQLYKGMALKLESAQLAVLKEDNLVFYANLDSAMDWLTDYFDPGDVVTINMKNAIAQLRKENLEVTLPDVSGSLRLLKQEVARLNLGKEVQPQ